MRLGRYLCVRWLSVVCRTARGVDDTPLGVVQYDRCSGSAAGDRDRRSVTTHRGASPRVQCLRTSGRPLHAPEVQARGPSPGRERPRLSGRISHVPGAGSHSRPFPGVALRRPPLDAVGGAGGDGPWGAKIEIAVSTSRDGGAFVARVVARAAVTDRKGAWALYRLAEAQGLVDFVLAGAASPGRNRRAFMHLLVCADLSRRYKELGLSPDPFPQHYS